MASNSLTNYKLTDNDVCSLSEIITSELEYYQAHQSPFHSDYLSYLKSIAGLGFTASLVGDYCLCIYRRHLNLFIDYIDKTVNYDFKTISNSVAEMIRLALLSFDSLRFPNYYKDFIDALKHTLRHIILSINEKPKEKKEADRLLKIITSDMR